MSPGADIIAATIAIIIGIDILKPKKPKGPQ